MIGFHCPETGPLTVLPTSRGNIAVQVGLGQTPRLLVYRGAGWGRRPPQSGGWLEPSLLFQYEELLDFTYDNLFAGYAIFGSSRG